jgi:hypothetical protein
MAYVDEVTLFTNLILLRSLVCPSVRSAPDSQASVVYNCRVIAQAVNRNFPISVAWVPAAVRSRRIVLDKVALRLVFSEDFCFPCQFLSLQLFCFN